jgi:NADPH2 dehydrogenase
MAKLFESIKIRDIEFKNRIVMPPMCMYSSDDSGYANDWHFIHYGTRAIGGTGLIIVEATGVERRGRITDRDLGIWDDSHIVGLSNIATLCKKYGSRVGIQLGHAGRKCEVDSEDIIAPSPIAYNEKYKVPRKMSKEDIDKVVKAFKEGAKRADEAGFDLIEIHAAHGYLINQFLSPLSNKRDDEYGGSVENRARILKDILREIRKVWPENKPVIVRVSAEDYVEDGNHPEDLAEILNLVKDEGVDLVNVSSGAVVPARIKMYPGYQVRFAEVIKRETKLPVIAGGLISEAEMAEEIVSNNRADMIFLGRELLRNPYWPLNAAKKLGYDIDWPVQYERAKK